MASALLLQYLVCVRCACGRLRCASCILLLLAVACCGGCGNRGPERVIVSGTVSFNGKPLSQGFIRFVPFPANPGPTTAAVITEGKYKADARGGVPVGTHNVRIEAYRKVSAANTMLVPGVANASREDHRQQWLPARFNTNTNLQFTVETGSSAMTKNFDLAN